MVLAVAAAALFPAAALARTGDPVAEVASWERFGGMVTVAAPQGHGNHAGVYAPRDEPIPQLDAQTAQKLIDLRFAMDELARTNRNHIGFSFAPGDWVLLVGAPNGAIGTRYPFTVTDRPVSMEISGLFYDPRSFDFAIRLQSSYIGHGKLDGGRGNPETDIRGGALYVEASWEQLWSMVSTADYRVTSVAWMQFSPNKLWNMRYGGELISQRVVATTQLDMIHALGLQDREILRNYREWEYLLNGKPACCMVASGVCGMVAVAMNPLVRLLLDNGVAFESSTARHSANYRYNPTGTDPLLRARNAQGSYFVVDTTVVAPSRNAIVSAARPFTMRVTTLSWQEGAGTALYVAEAMLH
jgi:hypothetical protein